MLLTIGQLLEKTGGRLRVPAYQRRYVWGEEHFFDPEEDESEILAQGMAEENSRNIERILDGMCQSVKHMVRTGEPLFISGITLCKTTLEQGADGAASDTTVYDIVDGQQRLTFLRILLEHLGLPRQDFQILYACRPKAQAWLKGQRQEADTQDTFLFASTLRLISAYFPAPTPEMLQAVLSGVQALLIEIEDPAMAITTFQMMNGTKAPMPAADVIKADVMRLSSMPQAGASAWKIEARRARYASEWEDWARWWNRADVRAYYGACIDPTAPAITLLLKLCLRSSAFAETLDFSEFRQQVGAPRHARIFFDTLHYAQARFRDAYADPVRYNRIKAIMLLQRSEDTYNFLHDYFVKAAITPEELERLYKLSFLGMSYADIKAGVSPAAKFDELVAALGMADVYHTEAKRDAYNLLLRLNIDEDIKLGRKFDFSIWTNRSLEHIYSKSKVWHLGPNGQPLDGNDNPLRVPVQRLSADPSYLRRDAIVNADGVHLSEHCIGNLVLLYGQNNSAFGNTSFEEKKAMFLAPGGLASFQSRNLLHSVCVFAGKEWTGQSIVDNYNLTLKNLKLYYGFK